MLWRSSSPRPRQSIPFPANPRKVSRSLTAHRCADGGPRGTHPHSPWPTVRFLSTAGTRASSMPAPPVRQTSRISNSAQKSRCSRAPSPPSASTHREQPVTSPAPGFQVLLANDARGPNGFIQRRKTGSLHGVRHVWKQFIRDNEWFTLNILVRQKQVQVRINDMLVVDYIEPDDAFSANAGLRLSYRPRHIRAAGAQSARRHILPQPSCPPAARCRPATLRRAPAGRRSLSRHHPPRRGQHSRGRLPRAS